MYCEFLHDDSYGKQPPTPQPVFRVPIRIILALVDQDHFSRIMLDDAEYIDWLADDIARNGVLFPLELAYDDQGAVTLREGHHRLRALQVIGAARVPVKLFKARRATSRGLRRQMVLPEFTTEIPAWFRLLESLPDD